MEEHGNDNGNEYVCNYCLNSFTRQVNLNQHLKNRPDNCIKLEQRIKEKLEQKLQQSVDHAKRRLF